MAPCRTSGLSTPPPFLMNVLTIWTVLHGTYGNSHSTLSCLDCSSHFCEVYLAAASSQASWMSLFFIKRDAKYNRELANNLQLKQDHATEKLQVPVLPLLETSDGPQCSVSWEYRCCWPGDTCFSSSWSFLSSPILLSGLFSLCCYLKTKNTMSSRTYRAERDF